MLQINNTIITRPAKLSNVCDYTKNIQAQALEICISHVTTYPSFYTLLLVVYCCCCDMVEESLIDEQCIAHFYTIQIHQWSTSLTMYSISANCVTTVYSVQFYLHKAQNDALCIRALWTNENKWT